MEAGQQAALPPAAAELLLLYNTHRRREREEDTTITTCLVSPGEVHNGTCELKSVNGTQNRAVRRLA